MTGAGKSQWSTALFILMPHTFSVWDKTCQIENLPCYINLNCGLFYIKFININNNITDFPFTQETINNNIITSLKILANRYLWQHTLFPVSYSPPQ